MAPLESTFADIAVELETQGLSAAAGQRIADELAKVFNLREDEVAILTVQGNNLHFSYPISLQKMGTIPVNTNASVAARVANTKRPEITNNFAQTKHASVFEAAVLAEQSKAQAGENRPQAIIHKLMSAPVLAATGLKGVIQVCRKGVTAPASGPDFTAADLQKLITISAQLAKSFKAEKS